MIRAKKLHKYLGIPLCVLLFLASLSGIILNHRELLQQVDIPRALLPKDYLFDHWNNGAVRGVLRADSLAYIYGGAGVWRTDSTLTAPAVLLDEGFVKGGDEAKIMSMARDHMGRIWVASQYRLYRLDSSGKRWEQQPLPSSVHGRLADMQIRGDSLLLLSRSLLYQRTLANPEWKTYELGEPDTYTGRLLLFRIVWALHSGEYFGLTGRLIVDLVGLLVMILCLTGIFYSLYSHRLMGKKNKRGTKKASEAKQRLSRRLSFHFKLHKRLGTKLFYIVLFVFVTGWLLRPPMMIPLVLNEARPNRFSSLYSENPWFDRLRAIRYDETNGSWLLSTSEGFFTLTSFTDTPEPWGYQPQVSPMGINAFAQRPDGSWIIGSFAGLFEVHPEQPEEPLRDYFTHEPVEEVSSGRPIGAYTVSGLLAGANEREDLVFLYDRGAVRRTEEGTARQVSFTPQPRELNEMPYSLWQAALELHAGRLYSPFLGKWGTELFIFFLGLASIIVLVTGLHSRRRKRKAEQPPSSSEATS